MRTRQARAAEAERMVAELSRANQSVILELDATTHRLAHVRGADNRAAWDNRGHAACGCGADGTLRRRLAASAV